MVYAPHGRTGIYMIQDGLRLLAPADQEPAARLDIARRVMKHLPETAWLRANRSVTDHLSGGDAGLYDLLLNPRDRAYTVPALHDLLAGVGLTIACWVEPIRYDPIPLLPDPRLRARIATLAPLERAALAEALAGNIAAHIVYCTRASEPPERADPFHPDAVPICREVTGEDLAKSIQANDTMFFGLDGLRVPVAVPPMAGAILRLIDGRRSVARDRRPTRCAAAPAPRRSAAPGGRCFRLWKRSTACCSPRQPCVLGVTRGVRCVATGAGANSAAIRRMMATVAASAGKNASIASSARVISTGLPNTVVVLKNASGPCTVANRSGTASVSRSRGLARLTAPAGIG